jgi:hypothetical protein
VHGRARGHYTCSARQLKQLSRGDSELVWLMLERLAGSGKTCAFLLPVCAALGAKGAS